MRKFLLGSKIVAISAIPSELAYQLGREDQEREMLTDYNQNYAPRLGALWSAIDLLEQTIGRIDEDVQLAPYVQPKEVLQRRFDNLSQKLAAASARYRNASIARAYHDSTAIIQYVSNVQDAIGAAIGKKSDLAPLQAIFNGHVMNNIFPEIREQLKLEGKLPGRPEGMSSARKWLATEILKWQKIKKESLWRSAAKIVSLPITNADEQAGHDLLNVYFKDGACVDKRGLGQYLSELLADFKNVSKNRILLTSQ